MKTVRRILSLDGVHELDDMDINDSYKVDQGEDSPYMPLTMEKTGEDKMAVDHHYIQRMDYMRDPEVRFQIEDFDGDIGPNGWNPIEYRQDGFPQVYERDVDGLGVDVVSMVRDWDRNLDAQNFYEEARDGRLTLNGETVQV